MRERAVAEARSLVGASFNLKEEVATPSICHYTTHSTDDPYPPSGHGLTWPVSSSSLFCRSSYTVYESPWSWHNLRLWTRSPIPLDIASLLSSVSRATPSDHVSWLLQSSFHVYNASTIHRSARIASINPPRLASTLDLFHQDIISIHFRSLVQDLSCHIWGETSRLDQALTLTNSQLRPMHVS